MRSTRKRLGIVLAVAMVASIFGASAAQGAPDKEFRLTIEPGVVVNGEATEFTATITNLDNNVLGAVEIVPPASDWTIAPGAEVNLSTWTPYDSVPGVVRLAANSQMDRLANGQSVTVTFTATPPPSSATADDADEVVEWSAVGRQANNFNSDGNEFFQRLGTERDPALTVVYRGDNDQLVEHDLLTYETLVLNGDVVDCAVEACTGFDAQGVGGAAAVEVEITLLDCDAGTVVIDATQFGTDVISIAGFFTYLSPEQGESCLGGTAVINFLYPKSLNVKPGELKFQAFYNNKLAGYTDYDQLQSCSKSVLTNCVEYVKGGSAGVEAQIILPILDSDPGGMAFR